MTGVNLNGPDLKLVRSVEQAPARASALPRAEADFVSAQQSAPSTSEILPANRVAESQKAGILPDSRPGDASRNGEVEEAVSRLNDFVQSVQRDLQFEVDRELGETIVRVVDRETQEVIRQIPDEVALQLAEKLQQDEPLTLFEVKV